MYGWYGMGIQQLVTERIKYLCKMHGYNVNSLANRCGIPATTLKSIVYGRSKNTGIVTIKLICDGLGISLFDFFDTPEFKNAEIEDIK